MSKGVLTYTGMKYDAKAQMEKPHFTKKDGGEWALGAGSVDWSNIQPGKVYVEWDNWIAIKATKDIPAGGGGGFGGGFKGKPQVYLAETFVSNVCGQAIAAGLIKTPSDLPEWAKTATSTIKAVKAMLEGNPAQSAPVAPVPQHDDFEDTEIPF